MSDAWKPLLSIWFVFFVTFIIFPGVFYDSHFNIMSNIGQTQFTWFTLSIILAFNILDTIGRKLGGYIGAKVEGNFSKRAQAGIYLMSIGRLLFVVIAILIAMKEPNYRENGQDKIIESDAIKIANLLLFSITNGLVSTLCAIIATSSVSKQRQE